MTTSVATTPRLDQVMTATATGTADTDDTHSSLLTPEHVPRSAPVAPLGALDTISVICEQRRKERAVRKKVLFRLDHAPQEKKSLSPDVKELHRPIPPSAGDEHYRSRIARARLAKKECSNTGRSDSVADSLPGTLNELAPTAHANTDVCVDGMETTCTQLKWLIQREDSVGTRDAAAGVVGPRST